MIAGNRFIETLHVPLTVIDVDSGAWPEAGVHEDRREHLSGPALISIDEGLYRDTGRVELCDLGENRRDSFFDICDGGGLFDNGARVFDEVGQSIQDLSGSRYDVVSKCDVFEPKFAGVFREDLTKEVAVDVEQERDIPAVERSCLACYPRADPVGRSLDDAFLVGVEHTEGPRVIGGLRWNRRHGGLGYCVGLFDRSNAGGGENLFDRGVDTLKFE